MPILTAAARAARASLRGADHRLALVVLAVHVVALVWFCASGYALRLLAFRFQEAPTPSFVDRGPDALAMYGYAEDAPADLAAYRAVAAPLVAGASTDLEKMRRLADYMLSLRKPGAPLLDDTMRQGLSTVFAKMKEGRIPLCGHTAALLAAFWRSLGGDARLVRWASVGGAVGHYGVELYSGGRWIYYDVNVNAFAVNAAGAPLSLSALRQAASATGDPVKFETGAVPAPWTVAQLLPFFRLYPITWYTLNDQALYMEPDRRFGPLHRWSSVLSRLPYPLDRLLDNLVGLRDQQLVVAGTVRIDGLSPRQAWGLVDYLLAMIGICVLVIARRRHVEKPLVTVTAVCLGLETD